MLWTNVTFLLLVRHSPLKRFTSTYTILSERLRLRFVANRSTAPNDHDAFPSSRLAAKLRPALLITHRLLALPQHGIPGAVRCKSHCILYHSLFFTLKNRYIAISSHCIQFPFTTFTMYKFNLRFFIPSHFGRRCLFPCYIRLLASWDESHHFIRVFCPHAFLKD